MELKWLKIAVLVITIRMIVHGSIGKKMYF